MILRKRCEKCGQVSEKDSDIARIPDSKTLTLDVQSTQQDLPILEHLSAAEDGMELVMVRLDDTRFELKKIPRETAKGVRQAPALLNKSREDLETLAAEKGLKIEPNWNKNQLAKALQEHMAKKELVPA